MSFDRMLLWLSAKGKGSWAQFRTAVEAFQAQQSELELGPDDGSSDSAADLPVYQQVRFALQRLGHVEFHTTESENGWRVAPPTVAICEAGAAHGLLCGARSPVLLESLATATDLVVERSDVEGMPERIKVCSTSHDLLVRRVRELGFLIQREAPVSLLSALPSVRDRNTWRASEMPETPGWLVHRFSSYPEPHWRELPQAEARNAWSGLFRFVRKHQRLYYLRWRKSTFRVPVQVGKYAVTRRRRGTLTYQRERRTLSVSVAFRPPLLVERALVLCSGVLPSFDVTARRLDYSNVREGVAHLAAQLLNQEIR